MNIDLEKTIGWTVLYYEYHKTEGTPVGVYLTEDDAILSTIQQGDGKLYQTEDGNCSQFQRNCEL